MPRISLIMRWDTPSPDLFARPRGGSVAPRCAGRSTPSRGHKACAIGGAQPDGREGVTGMLKPLVSAAALAVLLQAPAVAGQAADTTRSSLYEGAFDVGRTALSPLADAGDQEARFGLGFITFVETIEGFAQ